MTRRITGPRTAGGWALACAAATLALMAALTALFGEMGLFVPMIPFQSIPYWGLALATLGCALVALCRRQWWSGIGALLLLSVSLLPSAALLYQCAWGNCF